MISVIIANYNKEAFVERTILSALAQDEVSEVIVVDDASSDGSLDVIRRTVGNDPRAIVIGLETNRGQSFTENRGLERATGKYVIYLDSDDLLAPACCADRLRTAEDAPGFDAWVFPMTTFADDPEKPNGAWIPRAGDHLCHVLAHKLDWQLMQALWRREFLVRIGGFDETFVRLTDVSLHTRALLAGARVKCFPGLPPDCMYRIAPERYSWSVDELAARHVKGAIHYVTTYRPQVPAHLRHLLAGTLLAAIHRLVHWRRIGKLSPARFDELSRQLVGEAHSRRQRAILKGYLWANLASPIHVRGLSWMARKALRLPIPSAR
jgi:glycosyltransferase involved in cell wall biosynthesis